MLYVISNKPIYNYIIYSLLKKECLDEIFHAKGDSEDGENNEKQKQKKLKPSTTIVHSLYFTA